MVYPTDKLRGKVSLQDILTLCQILVIVVGAGWGLFLFLKFDKSLKISQDIEAKLKAQLDTLDLEKQRLDLTQIKSPLLVFDDKIQVTDLGRRGTEGKHLFAVTYTYSVSNNGRSKHEVTYVVLNAFLGELRTPAGMAAFPIPGFEGSDFLKWNCVCSKGHYYAAKWDTTEKFVSRYSGRKVIYRKGGGGTSELESGQSSNGSIDLVVLARPNDLVGFEATIGIDDGKTPGNKWGLRETEYLRNKN